MMTDEEMDTANKMMTRAADDLQNFGVDSVLVIMTLSNHKGTKKCWAMRGNHYSTMGAVHEFAAEMATPKSAAENRDPDGGD